MISDPLLQRVDDALAAVAGPLTVAQLDHRPRGKWSIAEILEHLGRTFSATALGTHHALEAGRSLATRPSLRSRIIVFAVVELGYFPSGRRSPKIAEPLGVNAADALVQTREHLQAMDGALRRAADRFGTRVKFLDHPILGPLTIRQWRRFHWIHTRHHIRQIALRIK